jgi:hypothetical protein
MEEDLDGRVYGLLPDGRQFIVYGFLFMVLQVGSFIPGSICVRRK